MQVPNCLWNSCLGSLDRLFIALYDIMTWSYASSWLKVLEVFISKAQNQASSYAQLCQYPFQSYTYKFKHIATFRIVSLLKLSASKRSLDWFIFLGHSRTRPSTQSPWDSACKMALHPPKKKEMHEWHSCLKKKRRGRCRVLDTKTSFLTCTWPMRWASKLLRDTRFDLAI